MENGITIPSEVLSEFCQRHHIEKLALFGSVLHEGFGAESDVDFLVVFKPGFVPGLAFFSIEKELSQLIGRKADLNTPNFLSEAFREHVMEEAETLYGEG
ncbi:MAG: nucleotidyltransferase domain-containing protein [SAR324 cluster bacterium]|nr:nucleotidyltransferase domain-containing protein [SAR324 cluster bacterium]